MSMFDHLGGQSVGVMVNESQESRRCKENNDALEAFDCGHHTNGPRRWHRR